jgi:hypothetical protein
MTTAVDTRKKIKTWEELHPDLMEGGWKVLVCSFDPMTADLAMRIESVAEDGEHLLIVIRPSENALFDSDARAKLAAGLRSVDAVMIETSPDWRVIAGTNARVTIVDEGGCAPRRIEFEHLVIARQRASAEG